MAREVTLGVQSTLHRAHLPIPSRGLPAPSSAGLLGSCELGAGPLPAPHGQGPGHAELCCQKVWRSICP